MELVSTIWDSIAEQLIATSNTWTESPLNQGRVSDMTNGVICRKHFLNRYNFDKATAMREAMLSMLKDENGNPDALAWAAFTVIGKAE